MLLNPINTIILLLHLISSSSTPANPPVPLTKIQATQIELKVFPSTLLSAIQKLTVPINVIHVIGASDVEASIDWSPVCQKNIHIVLIGPKATALTSQNIATTNCTTVVVSKYSRSIVAQELATETHLHNPSLVIGFNVDIYMPYWKDTMVDIVHSGVPVVVTLYCQYEGAKLARLLKWEYDDATLVWDLEANPFAHKKPVNCYKTSVMKGLEHGVRNSFWMSFQGITRNLYGVEELGSGSTEL